MKRASDLHKEWMKDPEYRKQHEALAGEYARASAFIGARGRAGLTQEQLAKKMGTTQSVIARLESGRVHPSMRTLEKLAKATGTCLEITFKPRIVRAAS